MEILNYTLEAACEAHFEREPDEKWSELTEAEKEGWRRDMLRALAAFDLADPQRRLSSPSRALTKC